MKRFLTILFTLFTALSVSVQFVPVVRAQEIDVGLDKISQSSGLSAEDPRKIAARIINYSLGFLGIILVCLILYAGFTWMTAGGDPEKVGKAKRMIRNAIIGLVIILSAWAITTFVISKLLQATGDGGGGFNGDGSGGGGGGLGGGGSSTVFQLRSVTPVGDVKIRNVEVRFLFTQEVSPLSASSSIRVLKASDKSPVSGTVAVAGTVVTFTPSATCPAPNGTRRCLDANTDYLARVEGSLRSQSGRTISCGGFSPKCEYAFKTGSLVDVANPTAQITYPLNGQSVSADDLIQVMTSVKDDSGVSYVESFVNGKSIGADGPASNTVMTDFPAKIEWDTARIGLGTYSLQSTAHDIDSNNGSSQGISVQVRPAHCFNGRKDEDETGLDCGALCGACGGGACKVNTDCNSGLCVNGICVEQPTIISISPQDGKVGTFVTLSGVNFGSTQGKVIFPDGKEAAPPAACVGAGLNTWSETQVIVEVPAGAKSGSIQLTNSSSKLSDSTNDGRGPKLNDFVVNNVTHPGLCGAKPNHGQVGDKMELIGGGLGDKADKLTFGDRVVNAFTSWKDGAIGLNVPVYSPATYSVTAQVGNAKSNSISFHIDEKVITGVPTIDRMDPEQGPIGEYVTLMGRNFGSQVGSIIFKDQNTGETGQADVNFPPLCSKDFWEDAHVVVKVPKNIGALGNTPVKVGVYQVTIMRQDRVLSNSLPFQVTNDAPKPGICAIEPGGGPAGTEVSIVGERFGGAPGKVNFSSGGVDKVAAISNPDKWKEGEVRVAVPKAAVTGPVQLSQGSKTSNAINYEVRNCNEDPNICGKESCCQTGVCSVGGVCPAQAKGGEYAWRTSTGIIPINPEVVEECNQQDPPSPSPWSGRQGGNVACLNSDLVIRFNTKLDPKSVDTKSILVQQCTGDVKNPCSKTNPVSPRNGYPKLEVVDDNSDYVLFRPSLQNGLWAASTTYQIIVTTAIKSDTQIPMKENAEKCGKGNGYCFRFTTQTGDKKCQVGIVSVAPSTFTAKAIGQEIPYRGSPRAAGDICIQLDGSTMDWTWDTGKDGRASITNNKNPDPPGNVLDAQIASALAETGQDPVRVNATINQGEGAPAPKGTGLLSINFVPPQVEEKGPACDQACVNAAIWVKFNVAMQPESLNADTIILKKCTTENCRTFDPPNGFDLHEGKFLLTVPPGGDGKDPKRYLTIEPTYLNKGVPTTYLEPGRFYKVIIRGGEKGAMSLTHLPLVGLNDPEGFAWTFRTKVGDEARCGANTVNITPVEKYETVIGARQSFVAQPIGSPDACNKNGQPLISDRSYDWTSSNLKVGKLINSSGDGVIDTTSNLPAHCSDRCVNTGADGIAGMVASCGNGTIETTDRRYCNNGKTPFGENCTLMQAGAKGGEECDLGGNKNGPNAMCGSSCLWNAVRSVDDGGTCGNAKIDIGEQCDAGKSCVGGPTAGADCKVDADCGKGGACKVAERRGCSTMCQALGSRAGNSACGNGDIGDGETCDDGNTSAGDGCSTDCLHEGSRFVTAICGNGGAPESGESCEKENGGPWPALGCDAKTCLHVGTKVCSGDAQQAGCCGNAKVEAGEDCDDGNSAPGDGCSAKCLAEGSSFAYGKPSFCGDGVLDKVGGEQCEAAKPGDKLIDALQVGEIVGNETPDKDGLMSTDLKADYEKKIGKATYGLQCGFKDENACPGGYGLTTAGCCALRPTLKDSYPPANAKDVCRNVLISGTFPMAMDSQSLKDNLLVAKEYAGPKCPEGTKPLAYVPGFGWWGHVTNVWHSVVAFFVSQPVEAAIWCVSSASGQVDVQPDGNGTKASFILGQPLDATSTYQVMFRGGAKGIKTALGVVAAGDITWSFETGKQVCLINTINIRDKNPEHPNLFTRAKEKHAYEATAQSVQKGIAVPLSIIPNYYDWKWETWVSSNDKVLTATGVGKDTDAIGKAEVSSLDKNGSSLIFAGVAITSDKVSASSTVNAIVKSSKLATALLCERPWPSRDLAPFTDAANSKSLAASSTLFVNGPFYNFSTLYCLDYATTSTQDDLPSLKIQPVPLTALDTSRGILRQYLFSYSEDELKNDGVGIRILANPLHLSPTSWYLAQGFKGSPQSMQVDGYEAIKDGNTTYVASVNGDNTLGGSVTSTIYLISFNPNARPETQNIYKQLVDNWTFNVNFTEGAQNVCVHQNNSQFQSKGGGVIRCTADWECSSYGDDLHCDSIKAKLQRDTKRVADFQELTRSLEEAQRKDGKYPLLSGGSFLQTLTTSRWPSWQATFGAALGGQAPPQDPVNKFLTCGRCSQAKTACTADSECPAGESCAAENGYDPATCWNNTTRRYHCPLLNPKDAASVSHVYQYRAVDGGARYEIATDLEGPGAARYSPQLNQEIKRCSNIGSWCQKDSDCEFKAGNGNIISKGTCNGTGGRWVYKGVCDGKDYGIDNVCGNGVIGQNEICEIGDTRLDEVEINAKKFSQLQICSDCSKWVNAPNSQPIATAQCGNGRVDKYICYGLNAEGYRFGQSCSAPGTGDAECQDPRDPKNGKKLTCQSVKVVGGDEEDCDEGALNGLYGHCSKTCDKIGAYCGDGQVSLGESCDNKDENGSYCKSEQGCVVADSCSIDCHGIAPYCGDKVVDQGKEQCDGNTAKTTGAICLNGDPCSTDGDCTGGGKCGGNGDDFHKSCVNVTAGVCVGGDHNGEPCPKVNCGVGGVCNQYPTAHTRTCHPADPKDKLQCNWNAWTVCEPQNKCGDGAVDPGEKCDAGGSNNDHGACTMQCKKNICGDAHIQDGAEECDNGDRNGETCNNADYGATCAACSKTCHFTISSGGYCGDGKKNGPEQCDQRQGLASCSFPNPPDNLIHYCDPLKGNNDCFVNGVQGTCNAISCKTLGYDYAASTLCDQYEVFCVNKNGEVDSRLVSGDKNLPKGQCTGTFNKTCQLDGVGQPDFSAITNFKTACEKTGGQLTFGVQNKIVDAKLYGSCKTVKQTPDILSCTDKCGFTGCARCQDNPGHGHIDGTVFDGVYYNQPVPAARVTLYLSGKKMGETFTDTNGKFEFNDLNDRPECGNYRIVVDSYVDNTCTAKAGGVRPSCNNAPALTLDVDEGKNGGYWPFESNTFKLESFGKDGLNDVNRKIFLAPRVGPDETLVIVGWSGSLDGDLDAHLVLPKNATYRFEPPDAPYLYTKKMDYKLCTEQEMLDSKFKCRRDVYWSAAGAQDLNELPHATLSCIKPEDPDNPCAGFKTAPETMKYKRGDWAYTGKYAFIINDYHMRHGPSYQYMKNQQLNVRVITQDRMYSVKPPEAGPNCYVGEKDQGKYWLVYWQDAASGQITIPSGRGELHCTNDSNLYQVLDTNINLPFPLKDTHDVCRKEYESKQVYDCPGGYRG